MTGPERSPEDSPLIPPPRVSVENSGAPLPDAEPGGAPAAVPPPAAPPPVLDHTALKSLLGVWALKACGEDEAEAVELHLGECGPCADEALRLYDAVALLQPDESLDLDPSLRSRVLAGCLERRPARVPLPEWAVPYDTEAARLDALLRDLKEDDWDAPVRLRWFDGVAPAGRETTVGGVIGHLMTVDGLVATALGLDDPIGEGAREGYDPASRTEEYWASTRFATGDLVHRPWREQAWTMLRSVSFATPGTARLGVDYGPFTLSLQDAFVERAFECWIHAGDIAAAVDYPYGPPAGPHLQRMVELATRLLPVSLAARRQAGLAEPAQGLVAAGKAGRSLRLNVEGSGGGSWYIALDSPGAVGSADHVVAQVAMEDVEFCRLAAGHVPPQEAAVGQDGDRSAIRDVLFATASLSRL
ncbi:maleylpyruvate isomerase N-terminal domain-containing protein [Streptomyces sp. NPDC060194]|uniref:maleylpyruvate isomerase N-terminal domain-containing protein n=1 Tax=Streptomyces sp. NPDC060194 TaxID=3347069 RepID=UPI003667F067